jgi:hypothetical protein
VSRGAVLQIIMLRPSSVQITQSRYLCSGEQSEVDERRARQREFRRENVSESPQRSPNRSTHSAGLSSSSRSFEMKGLTVVDDPSVPCSNPQVSSSLMLGGARDLNTPLRRS